MKAEPIIPPNTRLEVEQEDTGYFLVFYYAEDGNMVPVTRTTSNEAAHILVMGHNATL